MYDFAGKKSGRPIHKHDKKIALYVATTFENENEFRKAIEDLSIPTIKLPDDLPTDATVVAKGIREKKVDECSKI